MSSGILSFILMLTVTIISCLVGLAFGTIESSGVLAGFGFLVASAFVFYLTPKTNPLIHHFVYFLLMTGLTALTTWLYLFSGIVTVVQ